MSYSQVRILHGNTFVHPDSFSFRKHFTAILELKNENSKHKQIENGQMKKYIFSEKSVVFQAAFMYNQ